MSAKLDITLDRAVAWLTSHEAAIDRLFRRYLAASAATILALALWRPALHFIERIL